MALCVHVSTRIYVKRKEEVRCSYRILVEKYEQKKSPGSPWRRKESHAEINVK
jgi:hypothetical protein